MTLTELIDRLANLVRSRLVRLRWRLHRGDAAWERIAMPVPTRAFGPGSRRQFAEYLDGESSVSVHSLDDIIAWLQTCEYVADRDLFSEGDFWQHPGAFERVRRGDCEDFALWAWRKLVEIGIQAEFYVGRVICRDDSGASRQHAWVVYRMDGTEFLFEPAAEGRQQMIRRLDDVRDDYVPHFAVDCHLGTCAFAGCVLDSDRIAG
jgi:hypothetical protein